MTKQNKLCCNVILKNNDIYLKLYYDTTEIKLIDAIVYVLNYENNEYEIDMMGTSTESLKSTLKKIRIYTVRN